MNSALLKVAAYQVRDALRSRWLIGYAAFFALATDGLFRYGGGSMQALISLASIMLLAVPLVALVFGTVFLYGAREYVELLLAQPVRRGRLFGGLYSGLGLALGGAFGGGVGVPLVLRGGVEREAWAPLATILAGGIALTLVFLALAFVIAMRMDDRLKGLGTALGVWLAFALLYDGVVMVLVALLSGFPLERPLLIAMLLNPVDLVRVMVLLQSDASALMGYTGAVFLRFFTGSTGPLAAFAAISMWLALPITLGFRTFARKDF